MHARLWHRRSLVCMRCSPRTHALTCSHACAPARTHRSMNGCFPLCYAVAHRSLDSVAPPRTHRFTHAFCSHACTPARTQASTNGCFPLCYAVADRWLDSVAPPRIDSRMHADTPTQFICHVVSRVESRTHALIHALMQCVNGQKPRLDTDRHHGSIQCEKRRFRVPPLFLSPAI